MRKMFFNVIVSCIERHGRRSLLALLGAVSFAMATGVVTPATAQERRSGLAADKPVKLVSSDPKRDEKWRPGVQVKLVFSARLDPARVQIQVRDDVGGQLQRGAPAVAGNTVRQQLFPGISTGRYAISYSVAAPGAEPVTGEVPFGVVGAARPTASARTTTTPGAGAGEPGRSSAGPREPSPTGSAAPSPGRRESARHREEEPPGWLVPGGVGVVVLVGAGGVLVWRRRRSV
jgi:MYXO-CTERM domain-containing protein